MDLVRQRLRFEHVQHSRIECLRIQDRKQRDFVYQPTPGNVHQRRIGFHRTEEFGTGQRCLLARRRRGSAESR